MLYFLRKRRDRRAGRARGSLAHGLLRGAAVTRRAVLIASGVYLAASVGLAAWLLPTGREQPPFPFPPPKQKPIWKAASATEERTPALRQARPWTPTEVAA